MRQNLLLRRANPWTSKERHKVPQGLSTYPTFGLKFIDIVTPNVFIVIHAPYSQNYGCSTRHKYRTLLIRSAAYRKNSVTDSHTPYTCCRSANTDSFMDDISEIHERFEFF